MNLPALLHFSQEGGVFLPPSHEQEAAGFAVEPTDEGKKFLGIVVAKPVDEGEGVIGPGRVNQPTGGLIHDRERGMIEDDGGFHEMDFEEMWDTIKGRSRMVIKIKMRIDFGVSWPPVVRIFGLQTLGRAPSSSATHENICQTPPLPDCIAPVLG